MAHTMDAWTDYPLVQLGDVRGERAPIRRCTVVGFDGDKYVTIRVEGVTESLWVKRFYVYTEPGRCGEVPAVPIGDLDRMNAEEAS